MKDSKSEWLDDKCPACNGTGKIPEMKQPKHGQKIDLTVPKCQACGGTGRKKK